MRSVVATAGDFRRLARRRTRDVSRATQRDGFVLVEVLAAFAILTITLATLMIGAAGAVQNDDRAAFMLRATRVAQSEFEALGLEAPPTAGKAQSRTEDGLTVVLTVGLIDAPAAANPMAPKTIAIRAHIDVSRPGDVTGRFLTLGFDTLKIVSLGERRQ